MSVNAKGQRNLAPYSFFNCFNYPAPIIGFSCAGWKDSVANIHATGEFVWNLITRPLVAAMNETSASLPAGEDEFAVAGLTPAQEERVKAHRVAQSPVNFGCRLSQYIALMDASGYETGSWRVLGEVVAVLIDRRLLDADGVYQTAAAEPVLRGGGPSAYFGITINSKALNARPFAQP